MAFLRRNPTEPPDSSDSRFGRLSRRDAILVLIAPIIMFGVVINHHFLSSTQDLSPWKGGGFGMFATVDSGLNRKIITTATLRDGSIFADPNQTGILDFNSSSLETLRVTNLPDSDRLRDLADQAVTYYQMIIDDPEVDDDDIVSIRVEVAALRFDSRTNEASLETLRSIEVAVP